MLKLSKKNQQKTSFEIEHKNLAPEQLRLTKSIITELISMMETSHEDQFFHSSAELMRLITTAVGLAHLLIINPQYRQYHLARRQ